MGLNYIRLSDILDKNNIDSAIIYLLLDYKSMV
jgi:hypothetical protein